MTEKKLLLRVGEKYPLQEYPRESVIENTEYRGQVGEKHLFYFEFSGEKMCALADDRWITQKEDRTITHKDISSFAIDFLTAETLECVSKEKKSKLLGILNSAGVKL
ncbi:MAG: hypothetical protein PVJ67_00960 [Candidatus Pacearchaeota archaeon]|jgi:hypothetical protein